MHDSVCPNFMGQAYCIWRQGLYAAPAVGQCAVRPLHTAFCLVQGSHCFCLALALWGAGAMYYLYVRAQVYNRVVTSCPSLSAVLLFCWSHKCVSESEIQQF